MTKRSRHYPIVFLIWLVFMATIGCFSPTSSAEESKVTSEKSNPSFALVAKDARPSRNQEIRISIIGKNLTDLYAFEVNLKYGSDQLKLKEVISSIPGYSVTPIVKEDHIQFGHTMTGNVPGKSGDLTLCTFIFTAKRAGEATIALENVKQVNSQVEMAVQSTDDQVSFVIANDGLELKDISGHWAEKLILQAVQRGFVSGFEDRTFRPNRQVTRAEFVTMLARALELPHSQSSDSAFGDKEKIPSWAGAFVSSAVTHGLITGYEDNTFRAERFLTRAEMTTVIVKALGAKIDPTAKSTFADTNEIPAWALPYVAFSDRIGLVHGRGSNRFVPGRLCDTGGGGNHDPGDERARSHSLASTAVRRLFLTNLRFLKFTEIRVSLNVRREGARQSCIRNLQPPDKT